MKTFLNRLSILSSTEQPRPKSFLTISTSFANNGGNLHFTELTYNFRNFGLQLIFIGQRVNYHIGIALFGTWLIKKSQWIFQRYFLKVSNTNRTIKREIEAIDNETILNLVQQRIVSWVKINQYQTLISDQHGTLTSILISTKRCVSFCLSLEDLASKILTSLTRNLHNATIALRGGGGTPIESDERLRIFWGFKYTILVFFFWRFL